MFATAFSGVYVIAKDETIDFNELTAGVKKIQIYMIILNT